MKDFQFHTFIAIFFKWLCGSEGVNTRPNQLKAASSRINLSLKFSLHMEPQAGKGGKKRRRSLQGESEHWIQQGNGSRLNTESLGLWNTSLQGNAGRWGREGGGIFLSWVKHCTCSYSCTDKKACRQSGTSTRRLHDDFKMSATSTDFFTVTFQMSTTRTDFTVTFKMSPTRTDFTVTLKCSVRVPTSQWL